MKTDLPSNLYPKVRAKAARIRADERIIPGRWTEPAHERCPVAIRLRPRRISARAGRIDRRVAQRSRSAGGDGHGKREIALLPVSRGEVRQALPRGVSAHQPDERPGEKT